MVRVSPVQGGLPPAPPIPRSSQGPGQPPVLWVGGTLSTVAPDRLEIQEASGSVVTVQRLGESATAFLRVSGRAWKPLGAGATAPAGGPACVETVMAGSNLLALRVFLGADCGPA